MRNKRTKQTLKLRLLAFVLALALVWYSLNPAPRTVISRKREVEPPEEKKRNIEPGSMLATVPFVFRSTVEIINVPPSTDNDEDDFEWPEFIDG